MQIRLMTHIDLDRVIRNERQAYSHPWSESIFSDCIEGPSECWVAFIEKGIVGHLITSRAADEGHILNICIGREWQGQGMAHDLLIFALQSLRECGVDAVFLEVRSSNIRALSLYVKHGFVEIGRRKNYYPEGTIREDAIVMKKMLAIDISA